VAGGVDSTSQAFNAQTSSGTYVLNVSKVGHQVVDSIMTPTGETVLALSPGTSDVAHSVTAAASTHPGGVASPAQNTAAVSGASGQRHATLLSAPVRPKTATLVSAYCWAVIYLPVVVYTIYGPLIDAGTYIGCNNWATISMYVALYEWTGTTGKGVTGGGNGVYSTADSYNTYAFCYSIPYNNDWLTMLSFEWDNGPIYGGTSNWNTLACALY
jgi:hypothetical protein